MNDIKLNYIKKSCIFPLYDRYLKLSDNYFVVRSGEELALLDSSLKLICSLRKVFRFLHAIQKINTNEIVASGIGFIFFLKIENEKFIKTQEIRDDNVKEACKIIVLQNKKIIISPLIGKLIVLEKKKEKYEIIEKIKVEYNYEVEFLKNNSILLLETFIHYRFPFDEVIDKTSITILDFSEKEIKKETFNIGYKIEINTFEKLKNKSLFKLNDNFFIIASDKEIYFFNLKYKEIISKYELEARLLDIIYYKDNFYLCC